MALMHLFPSKGTEAPSPPKALRHLFLSRVIKAPFPLLRHRATKHLFFSRGTFTLPEAPFLHSSHLLLHYLLPSRGTICHPEALWPKKDRCPNKIKAPFPLPRHRNTFPTPEAPFLLLRHQSTFYPTKASR